MDDAALVDILDGLEDCADERCCIAVSWKCYDLTRCGNRDKGLTLRNSAPLHICYRIALRPCRDQSRDTDYAMSVDTSAHHAIEISPLRNLVK